MKTCRAARKWVLLALLAFSIHETTLLDTAQAQGNQGWNAVYNSSKVPLPVASQSFLDASQFLGNGQGKDLCDTIYGILTGQYLNQQSFVPGSVIDARGITTNLSCTHGSPWTEGNNTVTVPSTILLPAGTIVISTGWVLPINTHLIGEGDSISSGTVIQAAANVGNMISFVSALAPPQNPPSSPYVGIAVEKLVLDGNGQAVKGIVNNWASALSYVDHVGLYRVLGTGLLVGGIASGSGPYSNINFNTGSATATASTVCAQIVGQPSGAFTGTAGIRSLTCTSNGVPAPNTAVLLDAPSNSLKDVSIDGFHDGIAVGEDLAAQSNVLINISTPGVVGITNLIHICGSNAQTGLCPSSHPVTDLAILGATTPQLNCPPNQSCSTDYSIKDDATGTSLSTLTDDHVAMYVLGEPSSGGYSRFTTSPRAATWAFGTQTPSGSCSRGSLYSCTTTVGNINECSNALWVCQLPTTYWSAIQ